MKQLGSDDARRDWRDLLDQVEHNPAEAVQILRWNKPVAVVVSPEWFERAAAALEGEQSQEQKAEK
jgi:PHD/YefM family antitoxin component YafN of YafNO toxin-antitoxin module